ncbi:glutathione S-transferase family protein [Neosynechococcus sphagnicola]|uniref:glutathione S-transferase family protein n=1 Tax=Neosynechococcus sphagnicola TaxID=1501145 RepID=UPI001EF9EC7D|nr:glutathione S-transferase family protein [Neosynechococcus sphagnicola]
MLELYQFELSHYCEKVRLILDYKGLEYRKIDVTPGLGQLDVFKLSGQRQVPVLKDGNQVIADSTAIAKYLEHHYPDRPILPTNPKQRGLCWLIESWADQSLGLNGRIALLNTISQDADFRTALLPTALPESLKSLVGAVPSDVFKILGAGVGLTPEVIKAAHTALEQDLEALCYLLLGEEHGYLVADHPTLADFAVAGMSLYFKIPEGPYLDLPPAIRGDGGTRFSGYRHL